MSANPNPMGSRLVFKNKPGLAKTWAKDFGWDLSQTLVVYDSKLKVLPGFSSWLKGFEHSLAVKGGEDLKTLFALDRLINQVSKKIPGAQRSRFCVVAVGGGSVGDSIGFFASIYKRGVRWVNVPTTWLAAIDSAHGGKTALNSSQSKNQIGSFYPPTEVLLVKPWLLEQPIKLFKDALGEVAKTVYLKPENWSSFLNRNDLMTPTQLWKCLPDLIEVKMDVVAKDPYETIGVRYLLNWGHTLGHYFEWNYKWGHGYSVGQGLLFELALSKDLGFISEQVYKDWVFKLDRLFGISLNRGLRMSQWRSFKKGLLSDKKLAQNEQINVVLTKGPGNMFVKPVSVKTIYSSYQDTLKREGL